MAYLEEPDKGYAWTIAISSFFINLILSGMTRIVGILYVHMLIYYDVGRKEATLPFSVRSSVRSLAGPFVGILGERYGARNVTFVGGLIAAIGIALCVVAPNIIWLTVFWGGIHGIGFALANTLYRVTVNQYFKKYRATASGIALSGASFGSLGFPFLIDFILNNFTLPGTFLILAGITLHVLPFSLLLKTPFWIQYPKRHKRLVEALQRKKERERQQELIDVQEDEREMTSEISTIPASFLSDVPLETVQFKSLKDPHPLDLRKFRSFGSGLSQHLDNQDPGDGESEEQIEALQRKKEEERQQELIDVPEDETEMTSEISTIPASFLSDVPLEPVQLKSLKDPLDLRKFSSFGSGLSRHLDNQDPGGGESEEQSRLKELEETLDLFHQAPDSDDGSSSTSSTDHQQGEINSSQSSGKTVLTLATGIKTVFMLYKYPMYVVICIGTTQFQLVLTIVIAVLVDYGVDKGIPEFNGKYLINSMAIGDLIGRLCFGWVTDNKYLPKQTFMMAVHIFEGVFLILFPLANSFAFYVTILFFFGMMQGSSMILFSVLLYKYLPEDKQMIAIGGAGLIAGLVTLTTPLIIGHYRDYLGSYDQMFHLLGGLTLVTGILYEVVPMIMKCYDKKITIVVNET